MSSTSSTPCKEARRPTRPTVSLGAHPPHRGTIAGCSEARFSAGLVCAFLAAGRRGRRRRRRRDGSPGGAGVRGCKDVRKGLVAAVGTGLTVQGGGTLRQAQAVKSGYFDAVYFVTAEIQGAGLEGSDDVGTWAKSGPLKVGGGLIYSVDSIANEFSDWGDGGQTTPS
jgi:hypothetical protein